MKQLFIFIFVFAIINANDKCIDLISNYNHSLKLIAKSQASALGDDSAPRNTNRLLEQNTEYLKISIYLSLLKDNNCDRKKLNLDWSKYYMSAIKCQTDMLMGDYESVDCDITKWGE
tara:strand:- start:10 stop:360 length:351 start_codon:yes stop_codon:yes gene_type:complete